MLTVDEKDIDRITEVFHRLLKGETAASIPLPADYPDNEIRQLTSYVNDFLAEYNKSTALVSHLSKGELDFHVPRGKTLFLHSLKSIQSNLRHLTWKTQMIARGDFSHEVDFMGDFSAAFNTMVRKLKESFEALRQSEAETRELMAGLEAARLDAEAAARAKSQFLANMSHEIRTPMNSVLGFLELALEGDIPENHRENLKIAYASGKALLRLINDILDVSKLESGRMELEKRPFDLCGVVRDALKIFELKAGERGVDLTFRAHPDIPLHLVGDSDRLRQVIVNLVSNSLKFTEKGRISVAVNPGDPDGAPKHFCPLHFRVSDTGIGIEKDRLEKIFDPFTQADSSTARRFGGTGLGTTISKKIVELMGGRIWVESEVGKGSTFHFTIQLEPAAGEPEPIGRNREEAKAPGAGNRRFRILLAEDIRENIRLAKIRLEQQGHVVIVARNGLEAVEAFQRDPEIDIILMDVHMPEMDGLEASRRIREGPNGEVTIIALTASLLEEERKACREAGMDAVVGKPVDFKELFAEIERLVPRQRGEAKEMWEPENQRSPLVSDLLFFPEWEIEGVDLRKGLATWQDADAYRNALICFAEDYEDVAKRLKQEIERGDIEAAYAVAHGIKGVSGNLWATDVYAAATEINDAIARKKLEQAQQRIPDLERAMGSFVASVRRLDGCSVCRSPGTADVKTSDSLLLELFQGLLDAFGEYDPAPVDPFLKRLKGSLSSDRIAPIEKRLLRFDFEGAKEETIRLARELGMHMDGDRLSLERNRSGLPLM